MRAQGPSSMLLLLLPPRLMAKSLCVEIEERVMPPGLRLPCKRTHTACQCIALPSLNAARGTKT